MKPKPTYQDLVKQNDRLEQEIADLKKNKETAQIIADNTSDNIAITSFDLKAKYLYVSPSVKQIMGYEPEEMIGKSFFDFIHKDDKKILFSLLKSYVKVTVNKVLNIQEPGLTETIEFRFRNKAGYWRYMQSTINFVGKNLLAVTRDVTKQRKAEQALKISETKLKSILNTMDDLVFVLDKDSRFVATYASDNKLYIHQKDFIGKTHDEVMPKYINELFEQARIKLKKGESASYEYYMDLSKGRRWYLLNLSPLFVEKELSGIIGVARDITERIIAEEKIRITKDKYEGLFDNMKSGVAVYEPINNGKDFIFTGFNSAAEKIENIKREELIGKSVLKVFPKVKEIGLFDVFKRVWKTGKAEDHPVSFYKDGRIEGWRDNNVYKLDTGEIVSIYEDVTEKMIDLEEKSIYTSNLNALIENTQDMIWSIDSNYKLIIANTVFLEMTELIYGRRLNIGELLLDKKILSPKLYQDWKTIYDKVLSGEKYSIEFVTNEAKYKIWMENNFNPIYDENKKVIGVNGFSRNIDDRKVAEIKLKENETKFRLLAEYTYDWEYWIYPEGNYEYVSPSCERITGYKKEEFISNPNLLFNIVKPEYRKVIKKHYKDEYDKLTPVLSMEFPIINKDGEERWIEHNCSPVFNDDGEFVGRRGNNRDITDQIKAREDLKAGEEKLRSITDNTSDYIMLVNKNLNILFINKTVPDLKIEDVIGKSLLSFVPLDYHKIAKDKYKEVFKTGLINSYQTEYKDKDGLIQYFDVRLSPIMKDGKVINVVSSSNNITYQKQAEDRFQQLSNLTFEGILIHKEAVPIDMNDSFIKMFGYESKELQGKNLLKLLFSDEDRKTVLKNHEKEYAEPYEVLAKKKDGTIFPVEIEARSIVDRHNNSIRVAAFRDITEHQKLELELKESEYNLRTLFNAMNDIVFEMDYDGRYLNIAPTSPNLMFKPQENVIGKTLNEVFPKAEAAMFLSFIQKTIDEDKSSSIEYPLTLNNKTTWFEGTATPKSKNSVLYIARDITGRKNAEQEALLARKKVEESERKFRELFEKSGDAILIIENGLFVDCNKATTEMLEYKTKEDFLNVHPSKLSPESQPDGRKSNEKADEMMATALKNGTHRFEWDHSKSSGVVFPVEVLLTAVSNKPGNEILHVVWRDITERKQVLSSLLESEKRFRAITNQSTEGVTVTDMQGNYVFVNPAFCEMSGYDMEELLIMTVFDMKAKDQPHGSFYDSREKHEGVPIRVNLQRKDGTEYLTEIIGKNIEIDNDKLVLGTIRDISERVKAEKELLESEIRYKALHNASFGGIAIHDKGIILECNLGLSHISGFTYDELIGMDGLLLIAEKSRAPVMENILSAYEKPYEVVGLRKNGDEYPLRLEAREIPYKGKAARAVEFRDISEQKHVENELVLAKNKAEESDRLKSAFLANMSHEIRTPMNGIMGFASLLKLPDLNHEQLVKYTAVIEKSGKRMLNIINDLIDISKIEAGQMAVVLSEVNINRQIEYFHIFFENEALAKGLHFKVKNLSSEVKVQTDKTKFIAILSNLIKNAIKYTEKGSIDFSCSIKDDKVEFCVKDTGIGIPRDRLEAIFDRFVQADIEDRQAMEGAGLGLSISMAYAKMLGGKLWVESIEGKGTQFYFAFPYKPEENKGLVISDEEDGYKKNIVFENKLKVLIAEDEEFSDIYLAILIKDFSSEILHAKTGKETLELCRENPDIDLILMDIKMPVMDGYEASREIRKFNKDVVIIAQTAYALAGDREEALKAGCNDYVAKPINKDKIMEMIGEIFNKD